MSPLLLPAGDELSDVGSGGGRSNACPPLDPIALASELALVAIDVAPVELPSPTLLGPLGDPVLESNEQAVNSNGSAWTRIL
jgi:hypothetical protein